MKVDARMTLLVSEKGADIEITDDLSGSIIFRAEIPNEKFMAMLGRQGCVEVGGFCGELEKVGLKMEVEKFDFELPDCAWDKRKEAARKLIKKVCPEGWEADDYYNSQDSFPKKDGKQYARVTIRRWINPNLNESEK